MVKKPKAQQEIQREQVGVKLPPELIKRLDSYCASQPAPPTRTAVIEAAIRAFLDKHGK